MATFVSADWVSEHIDRPGYLIIDPRSAMRYLMGHLRGAVNVPFKKLQGPDGRIGQPEQLAAAFGEAGLGDDVTPCSTTIRTVATQPWRHGSWNTWAGTTST